MVRSLILHAKHLLWSWLPCHIRMRNNCSKLWEQLVCTGIYNAR